MRNRNRNQQESEAPENVEGQAADVQDDADALERSAIAEAPVADLDAEFPTPWHRDAYLEDLKREIQGAENRIGGLTGDGAERTATELQTVIDNARAELERVESANA